MKVSRPVRGGLVRCRYYWLAVLLLFSHQLTACPLCKTESGRQVREGIFNQDFGTTLLSVLAPFPILLGIIALAYWGPPLYRRKFPRNQHNHQYSYE